jgi:hypothetical protein
MDDSLIIARLTLMFLRASLPQADSLPPHYGVIMLPLDTVLTQEEAILKLSTIEGRLDFHADVRGRNLVVTAVQPTPQDLLEMDLTTSLFMDAIQKQNVTGIEKPLVRVMGVDERLVVPSVLLHRWLSRTSFGDCSRSVGVSRPPDPPNVVAVLYLGRHSKRSRRES